MNWIRYCGSKPADLKIFNESLGGRCDGCNIVATACVIFWFYQVLQWREIILMMSETNKGLLEQRAH